MTERSFKVVFLGGHHRYKVGGDDDGELKTVIARLENFKRWRGVLRVPPEDNVEIFRSLLNILPARSVLFPGVGYGAEWTDEIPTEYVLYSFRYNECIELSTNWGDLPKTLVDKTLLFEKKEVVVKFMEWLRTKEALDWTKKVKERHLLELPASHGLPSVVRLPTGGLRILAHVIWCYKNLLRRENPAVLKIPLLRL